MTATMKAEEVPCEDQMTKLTATEIARLRTGGVGHVDRPSLSVIPAIRILSLASGARRSGGRGSLSAARRQRPRRTAVSVLALPRPAACLIKSSCRWARRHSAHVVSTLRVCLRSRALLLGGFSARERVLTNAGCMASDEEVWRQIRDQGGCSSRRRGWKGVRRLPSCAQGVRAPQFP